MVDEEVEGMKISDDFIYTIDKKLSKKYFEGLIKENVWKALAVIHAGVQHQMEFIHYIHKLKGWHLKLL